MKVICVGHSTYDTTLPLKEYPTENLKYRIEQHIECGGGPAANGAYLLAKWGMDTTLISVIGQDYYGSRILEEFKKIGVNTDYIEINENYHTSSSYIMANMQNGSRTIITSKNQQIRKLKQNIQLKADIILVDGEHPETAKILLENNQQAITVLDAGRLNEDTKELGKLVSYVICSKDFAEEFIHKKLQTNDQESLKICHQKLENFFQTQVIITLESEGSFTKIQNQYKKIPSVKVIALDSTGAGDIFHGAFTYFIGNHYSLEESIHYASIAGAISVTRIGSRYSIPELKEVLEFDDII